MISYLHCLVFKEHCLLTGFVKSLSDFCKLSVRVSFYIIPHSVPFVKNFLKYFLSLLSKQSRQAFSSKALLCCISATTMYILQQICTSVNTFFKFFSYFFFQLIYSSYPEAFQLYHCPHYHPMPLKSNVFYSYDRQEISLPFSLPTPKNIHHI